MKTLKNKTMNKNNWQVKYLKDLCIGTGEYGLNSPAVPLSPKLPLYLRITDITDTGNYFEKNRASVVYYKTEKLLHDNDFLFARTGATVGKTYLYKDIYKKVAFAGYLIRFTPDIQKINPYFLALYCQTNNYWNWVSMRSGQQGISAKEYGKLPIPYPPIKEQQKIVGVLESWDKAINLTKRLIEQKELQKKYLMQQLLTGRPRLKGFNTKWKKSKLKQLCAINKGQQLNADTLTSTGLYPCLNGGIVPSGYTDKWNREGNTISISEGGNSCGYVNFNISRFWAGGHCYTLSDVKINNLFLYCALKAKENIIMKLRVGSGLPNIQRQSLENLILSVPSVKEQKTIAEVLSSADKEIDLLKQKLTKLEEQKKGLMQVLLTGKIRLVK